MVAPTSYRAKLKETTLPNDPTSGQHAEQLPPYVAYSADGDVTAPLVFVNYGVPADYEELERHGISVKGAIVIAKYGGSWRGIKPKVAAEHGAVGCLIYSDPRDDGYGRWRRFSEGPDAPVAGRAARQRRRHADLSRRSVDAGRRRDERREATRAYRCEDAHENTDSADFLRRCAAAARRTARSGSSGGVARRIADHVQIRSRSREGAPARQIRLEPQDDQRRDREDSGHHRSGSMGDSRQSPRCVGEWRAGSDLRAGCELEEARALRHSYKQGWRPKRTIIYAAWDGEEPGLLGSTEWVETHADELAQHAVAYINSDTNGRGYFGVDGSHSLEKFINGVGRDVIDPETKLTVLKRWQLRTIRSGRTDEKKEAREREDLRIDALGSGSDYSSFLDHAGVPSLNLGYGGEDDGGIYHSIYDDFYWFTHFSDSSYVYGKALSQAAGIAVMRLASADLLPFAFTNLAETAGGYVKQLKKLRDSVSDQIAERNLAITEGVYAATSDPRDPIFAPARQEPPPQFDFAPLDKAVESLTKAAEDYDKAYVAALSTSKVDPARQAKLRSINTRLLQAERALTSPEGLTGRPWYRHLLYAPGFYTGYGVKTIPGVREAIEQRSGRM